MEMLMELTCEVRLLANELRSDLFKRPGMGNISPLWLAQAKQISGFNSLRICGHI